MIGVQLDRCTIFGHPWVKTELGVGGDPDTYRCRRCGLETTDYLTPDRWPWLTGYPTSNP